MHLPGLMWQFCLVGGICVSCSSHYCPHYRLDLVLLKPGHV
uniref:Uncharacterized protein n=1 Tax=Arundo donax TaxID=35708 RepID=A0A0A8ZIZ0_ARUDO